LKTTSELLPGLEQWAEFITCLQFAPFPAYRCWGFWSDAGWIGPRHTNFPDGSICGFDIKDGTWGPGDALVELLDIYSLWALRHLHLRVLGRWPGGQSVQHAYERLSEFRDDELCGCDQANGKTYAECCKASDLLRPYLKEAVMFSMPRFGGVRRPPHAIQDFRDGLADPPPFSKVFDTIKLRELDHQMLPFQRYRRMAR
jgi:hypothetical protein